MSAKVVNPQVTDAVTQTNVKVLAESPAIAMANLYQGMSQTFLMSAQNSAFSQQQTNTLTHAIIAAACKSIANPT